MTRNVEDEHPINVYFRQALHEALYDKLGLRELDVEAYLSGMLVAFLHYDRLYGVRDKSGNRVTSISEMLVEGDVRLNADSFQREREVHRHIGDFLLFWSGLFPEFLKFLKAPIGKDALLDPIGQGRQSYYVASTFEHDPYGDEAKVLRKLSEGFETYQYGLGLVRTGFQGLVGRGWIDGFQA